MDQHSIAKILKTQIIDQVKPQLLGLSKQAVYQALAPNKWSPAQIMGHLVDSATYNSQRFIKAQWATDLMFDSYPQEKLVETQNYQASDWTSLVELWYWYNVHICHIISHISNNDWKKDRSPHSMQLDQDSVKLSDLVIDYIGHLEHHIRQIFPEYVHQTNTHYDPSPKI